MLARTNVPLKDHKTIWKSRKLHSKPFFRIVSRWVPLDYVMKKFPENDDSYFSLLKSASNAWEGLLSEGFFSLRFGGLIFGTA